MCFELLNCILLLLLRKFIDLFYYSGLKEYFGANPVSISDSSSPTVHSKISYISSDHAAFEESEVKDEFYDAIANDDSLEDEDSDDDVELSKVVPIIKKKKKNNVC